MASTRPGEGRGTAVSRRPAASFRSATSGGLAARSGAGVTGIGGCLALTAFDQTPQPERITGGTESATANNGKGGKTTATATLTVSSAPDDPARPEAGLEVLVQGPGIEFFVLYVFAQN